MTTRLAIAIAALLFASPAAAQVRSNIQDDPRSSDCTENCIDAGYEWAIANLPVDERDCEAANAEFAAGCDHWVQEQRDLAAPPLEEPVATDAAGPMPGEPMPEDPMGPMPEDGAYPPSESEPPPGDYAPMDEAPLEEPPLEGNDGGSGVN